MRQGNVRRGWGRKAYHGQPAAPPAPRPPEPLAEPPAAALTLPVAFTPDEVWLTPPQVAKLLGIDRRTALKWIKAGMLPAVEVNPFGKRLNLRIRLTDVEAYIAAHTLPRGQGW